MCECLCTQRSGGGVMELPLLFFLFSLFSYLSFLSMILPGWRWPSIAGCHSTGCARLYPLLVDILHCISVSLPLPPSNSLRFIMAMQCCFCMQVSWSFLFFCFCSILLSPSCFKHKLTVNVEKKIRHFAIVVILFQNQKVNRLSYIILSLLHIRFTLRLCIAPVPTGHRKALLGKECSISNFCFCTQ